MAAGFIDLIGAADRPGLRPRRLAAGETLFAQGDPAAHVFELTAGRLSLVRHLADGRAVAVHTARAPDSFAEAALFADAYHCDAVAATEAMVIAVPKALLLARIAADPAVAQALLARLARQVQALRARLELRDTRPAADRVLRYLMLNAGADGRTVTFDRPLLQVAAEIGLTHEALYRTLARLERDGAIRRGRDRIVLLDPVA